MADADMSRGRRVVIAPDSFKGSAPAVEVARAIAEGWRSVRLDDEMVLIPMADGGEGTLDAFAEALPGARRMPVTVPGPLGIEHETSWLLAPGGEGEMDLAVVELAGTVGIELLGGDDLRPLHTSSRGFGEAIRAALEHGVERLVLAIGSSASSDGGAGMLQALGASAVDVHGVPIAEGARGLSDCAKLDVNALVPLPRGGVTVLTDVVSPLLGPDGAAAIFAPQKGASESEVALIEHGLEHWAKLVDADPESPGSGAAGGVGFALLAWGVRLSPGAEEVAALVGLDALVADADLAVTGEGRYDDQSDRGKAPSVVLRAARKAGVETAVIAGVVEARPRNVVAAVSLVDLAGDEGAAMADAVYWLRRAGAELAHGLRRRARRTSRRVRST